MSFISQLKSKFEKLATAGHERLHHHTADGAQPQQPQQQPPPPPPPRQGDKLTASQASAGGQSHAPPGGQDYPPAGGGYPPYVGGYPPDAGGSYPPYNSGHTLAGGGYPPVGGGYPPDGGGYPPAQQMPYPPAQPTLYPPIQQAPYPPYGNQGGGPPGQSAPVTRPPWGPEVGAAGPSRGEAARDHDQQQAEYPSEPLAPDQRASQAAAADGNPTYAPGSRSGGGGGANNIRFINVAENELVHQRFLIVCGQIPGISGSDDKIVVHHPYFPPLTFPAVDGFFKVLAELENGINELRFDYLQGGGCIGRGALTIRMTPYLDKPPLLLSIVVGCDSQGVFDAPPNARGPGLNDLSAAVSKMRCSAYLWQAFVAEQMHRNGFGRRTFNLEEYYEPDTMARDNIRRMTARVHVIRSKRTVAEIQDKERAQQWRPPAGYKRHTEESQFTLANEAVDGYGMFKDRHYIACLTLDSHWDPESGVILGHAALGGSAGNRRIGVFGSHTTHAWPANAEEIAVKFLDTTKTDTRHLANDCNDCGEYWQAANIGMGSFLHECGHLLTLAHTPSGLMMRGSRDYNRAFMARAPNWKGPVKQADEGGAHWHRTDVIRLRHHPCLRLPSDPPLGEHEKEERSFEVLAVEDGVVICNNSGITMIEVWVNGTYRSHIEYTAENFPGRQRGSVPAGPGEMAAAFPQQVHASSAKLHNIAGAWAASDKVNLVLTSRATVTHSFEDYEAFVRNSGQHDSDGNRVFHSNNLGKGEMEGTVKSDALFSAKSIRSTLPKLRSIEIFSGAFIDGIVFHMDNGSRAQIGTCQGGGRSTLAIDADDDLDHIVVNCGFWIDGLEFVTVLGRRSGWKGGAGGGRVVLEPPPGYSWMGLSGSGARWLDSLTMHYSRGK